MMSAITTTKILINQRLIAVLFLGFSSGLPLALIGASLQAWFTESHVNLMIIGTLSLLGLPYIFKFLWAPLMDYIDLPWLGRRKGWILLMQLSLVLTLLLLAHMNPIMQAIEMGWVALFIAFFSASQDIAIDAYRTDILTSEERGLGAAYHVFAYRMAALISGGFAMICADYFGWQTTYMLMALLILLAMVPTYFAPHSIELMPISKNFLHAVVESLRDLLQRDQILLLLLFIIFYKLGDALALSLMTNFLLHGLGFSLTEVGLAYKLVGFFATIMGAFTGGIFLTRWNIYRALMLFGIAQAFSNLTFVVLAIAGKQFFLLAISIFIENFCSGLSTAALLAFLMSLCHRQYTAGQYALLSAFASLGRVFLGPVSSIVVENGGWIQLYVTAFLLSFPSLIILIFLKEQVLSYVRTA
ncbi:MAG TPA: MFS transporter [Gammaproteobacteria bacterium]|nr:MFS transporter [Gammaproteobacteria bacterium]